MNRFEILACIFACTFMAQTVHADNLAGSFTWPFKPYSSYRTDLAHLERNTDLHDAPFHAGEDHNRRTSDPNDDEGDALLAVADGTVVYVQHSPTAINGKGRMVIVRYNLGYGLKVDMAYLHCKEVLVEKYDRNGNRTTVEKGQLIARLGRSGTTTAHFHWESQWDMNLPVATNPYYGGTKSDGSPREPLTVENALRYGSPSLIVDDRMDEYVIDLDEGQWTMFEVPKVAPGSTAYFTDPYTEDRVTINEAVEGKLIEQYGVIYQKEDSWYYRKDVGSVYFEPGVTYAVKALVGPLEFSVLMPGDNFRDERAIQDMLHAASTDSDFREVRPDYFRENPYWTNGWELRYMPFSYVSNGGLKWVWLYHATNKANPLRRAWTYIDPDGRQAPWEYLDANTLN